MNTAVISAVGGLVIGAAASYFVTKKMVTKYANEEIESVKVFYKDQYDGKLITLGQEALKAKLRGESLSEKDLGLDVAEVALAEEVQKHLEAQIEAGLGMVVVPDANLTPFPEGPRDKTVAEEFAEEVEGVIVEGIREMINPDNLRPLDNVDLQAKQIIEDNLYAGPSNEEDEEGYIDPDSVPSSIYDEGVNMDGEPYAISQSTYNERLNDESWDQFEMTYYEDDDVLADDKDVVPNPEMFVGDGLTMFGVGMGAGKDEVYIRNERLEADYFVTRVAKSYTQDVLGFRTSSKTSKFSDDDE